MRDYTTKSLAAHLRIGRVYDHFEHGPIRIDGGAYLRGGRLSNHWDFTVLATGERKSGYGDFWPDISDQYVTITVPKVFVPEATA